MQMNIAMKIHFTQIFSAGDKIKSVFKGMINYRISNHHYTKLNLN